MEHLKVVKIGGKVIDVEENLHNFLDKFRELKGPKILIHGGGTIASKIGEKLDVKTDLIDGRRITNKETLDVITMVYGGLVNKKIVAKLQAFGVNAAGFSGADLNLISSKKRNPNPIDFGWVGDIEKVQVDWLLRFLRHDVVPVIAPLTHDNQGNLLNTNADSVASFIATALSTFYKVELIYCFEQAGVLHDKKVIPRLDVKQFEQLKKTGIITDGMIPKLDLGFEALKNGTGKISIRNFEEIHQAGAGTALVN